MAITATTPPTTPPTIGAMLVDFFEAVVPLPASLLLPLVLVDCDALVVDAEPVDSAVREPVEVPVEPDSAVDSGKPK